MYKWICKICDADNPCIVEMKTDDNPPACCVLGGERIRSWEPLKIMWKCELCDPPCIVAVGDEDEPNSCPIGGGKYRIS